VKMIDAVYGAPPYRDGPVVQLFLADSGPQWGEVVSRPTGLILEVYPSADGKPWALPVEEVLAVLQIAANRLA
jgi:hypothetical protein